MTTKLEELKAQLEKEQLYHKRKSLMSKIAELEKKGKKVSTEQQSKLFDQ